MNAHPNIFSLVRSAPLRRRAFVLLALTIIGILVNPVLAQPRLTATLDRTEIALGEAVQLTLSLEGATSGQPPLPAIEGLELAGQSSGQQVSIVNGQIRRLLNFNYALKPNREGSFTIPALRFDLGGTILTTPALQVNVTPDPLAAMVKRMAFGEMVLRKRALFVGEVFPIEFHLFFQNLAEDPAMPKFNADGFTMLGKPATVIDTVVTNGMNYQRIVFRLALVAAKAGELPIGPIETKLSLRVPRANRNDNDPFAAFMGRNYEVRTAEIRTEPVKVQVRPLPTAGAPADFNGSIGSFELTRSAAPTEVTVGDPITQKIRITGAGTFDAVKLTEPEWNNFRSYAPTAKFEAADELGIRGTKEFELVVSPLGSDVRQLPPLEFVYFDPESGQYRTLTAPPITLKVKPAETVPLPPSLAPRVAESASVAEIAHINPRLGTLRVPPQPWITHSWFVSLQGLPLVAFIGAFLWRLRREHAERNPHLRRSKEIAESIRRGLAELATQAAANRSEPFHATLFRLLQEVVGERLKRPAASITEAAIDELPEASDPQLREELHTLFRLCNEARYAPVSTAEQLTKLRSRAALVISTIRGGKEEQ